MDELRCGTGRQHLEAHRLGGAGVAVGDREIEIVGAGLGVARLPSHHAGGGIQRGAERQAVGGEGEVGAGRGGGVRHHHQLVALAEGLAGDWRQGDRLLGIGDLEYHLGGHAEGAVSRGEGGVGIGSGAGVARRPVEDLSGRIEAGARRQPVGGDQHGGTGRLDHADGEADGGALAAILFGRQPDEIRRLVAAGHAEHEALNAVRPLGVEGLYRDRGLRRGSAGHHPGDHAGGGIDGEPGRAGQHAIQNGVVARVRRLRRVGEGLAHGGAGGRRAGEGRRVIRIDRTGHADREIRLGVARIVDGDGGAGNRGARRQDAVGWQIGAEVDQIAPVVRGALGAQRQAGGSVGGAEHQHRRQIQVGGSDVGQRQVIRDGAGALIGAGVVDRDADHRRQIADGLEGGDIRLRQRDALGAEHPGDGQRVGVRQQGAERQQHGAGRRVIDCRLYRNRALGGADQRVVRGVQHVAGQRAVGGHILVEGH